MIALAPSLSNYQWHPLRNIMALMDHKEAIEQSHADFVARANYGGSLQHFVLKLIEYIRLGPISGLVLVIKSRKGALLGLVSGCAGTDDSGQIAFTIYSGWHNQKDQLVVSAIVKWLDNWCQERGYPYYQMETARSSGASIRCFEQKYGFKRRAITFRRDVQAFGQQPETTEEEEEETFDPVLDGLVEQGQAPAAS